METKRPDDALESAPRTDLRALAQLRDRVEAAAQEVERLRAENAALAARVAEFQDGGGDVTPVLTGDEDAETLKARIRGFIDAIDQVLSAPEVPVASRSRNG